MCPFARLHLPCALLHCQALGTLPHTFHCPCLPPSSLPQLTFSLVHRLAKPSSKAGAMWVGVLKEGPDGLFRCAAGPGWWHSWRHSGLPPKPALPGVVRPRLRHHA